jgi:hypothetical protein
MHKNVDDFINMIKSNDIDEEDLGNPDNKLFKKLLEKSKSNNSKD